MRRTSIQIASPEPRVEGAAETPDGSSLLILPGLNVIIPCLLPQLQIVDAFHAIRQSRASF